MTMPVRIKNNSIERVLDVEEVQITNDGKEQEHVSTYRLKPGEEYMVYVYAMRFFRLVEGPIEKRNG